MAQSLNLKLEENSIFVEIEKDSMKQHKVISYEDFSSGFINAVNFDSGILPGDYGVKYIKKTEDNVYKILYLEPARRIDYHFAYEDGPYVDEDDYIDEDGNLDEDAYNEALEESLEQSGSQKMESVAPILLWNLYIKEDRLIHSYLYAMKSPVYSGLEEIYIAPFNNVYDGIQEICWGHTRVKLPTLQAIQGLSFTFFNAYENFDLSKYRIYNYERENGYSGYLPIHLHEEIHQFLKDGKSEKDCLEYIHEVMIPLEYEVYNGERSQDYLAEYGPDGPITNFLDIVEGM